MNVCIGNGQLNQMYMDEKTGSLNCMHDQQIIMRGGDGKDYRKKAHTIGM